MTMVNSGLKGFKRIYLYIIFILNHFSIAASSTYYCNLIAGQTISTKREELMAILDQFNIQVDNPVAILTQETSRNFLHSKNAKDRYKVKK